MKANERIADLWGELDRLRVAYNMNLIDHVEPISREAIEQGVVAMHTLDKAETVLSHVCELLSALRGHVKSVRPRRVPQTAVTEQSETRQVIKDLLFEFKDDQGWWHNDFMIDRLAAAATSGQKLC